MLSESADISSLIILTYGRKNWNKDYAKVKFKPEVEVNILYSGVLIKGCMQLGIQPFYFVYRYTIDSYGLNVSFVISLLESL